MFNVILVGNPNVGKTTFFNTATKSSEKVTNWSGVTVGEKNKIIKYKNQEINIVDLPGIYSLDGFSNEEKIAADYLKKHKDYLIINISDANNLKLNLRLTKQLIEKGFNIVLALNMYNEVENLNIDELQNLTGIRCFFVDARKRKSVFNLIEKVQNISKNAEIHTKTYINLQNYDKNMQNITNKIETKKSNLQNKLDNIVLNKHIFFILFFTSMLLIFYITFGFVGELFSLKITMLFQYFVEKLQKMIKCLNISIILKSFICDVILDGFVSIFSFLPQIFLLLSMFLILEDIGFMSRVAFMFDGFMKKIGLSGKSIFSLFLGFSCTTNSVFLTRNLENEQLRKRTVFLLPFFSCSAKLPIFLVISSLFFEKYKYLFVFGLYLFSILIFIVVALILNKICPSNDNILLFQLPKYRGVNLKNLFINVISFLKDFILKIGGAILIFGSLFWFLKNFSFGFRYLDGGDFTNSILFHISNFLLPIFMPIGFDNAGIIAVLFFGLIAKEMVVVGLSVVNNVSSSLSVLSSSLVSTSSVCVFSMRSSIVFLVFILLYTPCISALSMIKNEIGFKFSALVAVFQFVLSYITCLIINFLLLKSYYIFSILIFILIAFMLWIVLKFEHKNKCRGCFNDCKKVDCGVKL